MRPGAGGSEQENHCATWGQVGQRYGSSSTVTRIPGTAHTGWSCMGSPKAHSSTKMHCKAMPLWFGMRRNSIFYLPLLAYHDFSITVRCSLEAVAPAKVPCTCTNPIPLPLEPAPSVQGWCYCTAAFISNCKGDAASHMHAARRCRRKWHTTRIMVRQCSPHLVAVGRL